MNIKSENIKINSEVSLADWKASPDHSYIDGGTITVGSVKIGPGAWNICGTPYVPGDQKGLGGLYSDVRKFHVAFNHPAPNKPVMLSKERIETRAKWTREEVQELEDAETLVDQADACIDIIYFAVGTLVELGIKPQALWDIVQAANMAKLGPDGKPLYHPDGKTRKPEGWQAPEPKLKAEVERQLEASLVG